MELKLKPIGYVKRLSKKENVKDRELVTSIVVRKDLAKALDGLEDFSHLYVTFFMHKVPEKERRQLAVHPRGRIDLPLVGVLATRTAFRPNPIGLTLVELVERRDNVLIVRGLDAFDGTPVIDLKPADSLDMVANITIPQWLELLEADRRTASHSRNIDLKQVATERIKNPS